MVSSVLDIKKQLLDELKKESINYNRILELSNKLSETDPNNVRFSVDAGIVGRLGKELVAKGDTAISELIKNSYDADATYVNLIFKNAFSTGGVLIIEDDGLGMTRNELINGFMRLSSSEKIHNPVSPNFKRIKAGRKGIGRFATQRLGKKLTIITQTKGTDTALKTIIDWEKYNIDQDIFSISNSIEVITKERDQGTTLIITDLYDSWNDKQLERAYANSFDLFLPEPLSKERKEWDDNRVDPGFKVSFFRESVSAENSICNEDKAFFNYALAVIEGYVNHNGEAYWKSTSSKLDIPHNDYIKIGNKKDDDNPYKYLRDVHFKAYYFIYERSLIPQSVYAYIKNRGNEVGGIKLYRNGFRIPPYGERGNDWLGLDESVRKRIFLFPHQNQSYFGYVEIDQAAYDLFEETSGREGVIENDAYCELTDFVYRAITTASQEIASIRQRKQTAGQKNWDKKSTQLKIIQTLTKLQEYSDENSKFGNDSEHNWKYYKERHEQYKEQFDELKSNIEASFKQQQSLIDENNMLRVYAGLGLVLGEFIHEIKNYLPAFDADINYLYDILYEEKKSIDIVDRLRSNMKSFSSYTAYFDKTISRNAHHEIEPIDIKERVVAFEKVIEDNRIKSSIDICNNLSDENVLFMDLNTIPMHPSEWASILFNLYTNSKKAIKKAGVNKGQIKIECGECNGMIYMEFSDNGCGIDPRVKNTMFDAFVTTTATSSINEGDIDVYTGTGLGLKIIKDIVTSYNGNIYIVEPKGSQYKTTFRIEIPKITS